MQTLNTEDIATITDTDGSKFWPIFCHLQATV